MNNTLITFVVYLVNKNFSHCSLLLLHDKIETGEWPSSILERTVHTPKYVINYRNDTFHVINNSQPLTFPTHMFNIRQYSIQCLISVILINYVSLEFMSQIRKLIAPVFLPISRKDLDHYVFVAEPELHEKILRMEEFVSKIKFKMAIGINKKSKQVDITTVDFFGGAKGSPKFIHLPGRKIVDGTVLAFPDFIWNLRGYVIKIVIPYARALLEAKPGPWVENNAKRGEWKYLFEEYIMVKFNCSYRMFPSTGKNGKFGGGGSGLQLSNGTWIGVVGDLYYGRADIGVAIANTDKRIGYIGFTDANYQMGCLTFVTGQPSKIYSSLAVFWPFHFSMWLWITISTVGALGFILVVTKCLQRANLESSSIKVNTQVLLILTPFVEQDCPVMPFSTPLRSFISFWSFFTLVVTNMYRSKLVTLLAFPVLVKLPKTYEELAFSDFQVGFMKDGDSGLTTISRSKDPVYVELLQRMEIIKGVNFECLEKVISRQKYACIAYDFDVLYLQRKNFSDAEARKLQYSNAYTYNVWLGFATQEHSIFRVNFDKMLSRVVPFHLAHIWEKMDVYENVRKPKLKWWADTNQSQKMSTYLEESHSDLTLNNMMGVFHIFLYCAGVSLFVFFYEVCKYSLV